MRGQNPPQPSGYDAEAVFHKRAWAKTQGPENELRDSATIRWRKTSRGIFADVKNVPRGTQGATGLPVWL